MPTFVLILILRLFDVSTAWASTSFLIFLEIGHLAVNKLIVFFIDKFF